MISEVDDYLERRGAKYFVTLTVLCYVIGTLIFNIYLSSLNISEFELLKLRYMFVGLSFFVVTSVFPLLYFFVQRFRRIFLLLRGQEKKVVKEDKAATDHKPKKPNARRAILETIIYVLFIPWVWFYSIYIFPEISAAFGGAKPEVARLIGSPETIKELNELIAYETGVEPSKLPFDLAAENSTLAVGANVKILDKNKDRYILILTKDLYLSSTSNVARKLLASGQLLSLEKEILLESFEAKPIYFSAKDIRGTTLTLYKPPSITTEQDLQIAAQVVAEKPEAAGIVQSVIAEDLPGSASQIVAAVQKKIAEKKAAQPVLEPGAVAPENTEPAVAAKEIEEILAGTVDRTFLDFRSTIFNAASALFERERRGEKNINDRRDLAILVTNSFTASYPVVWQQFSGEDNYLVRGQSENDFPRKIQRVSQGAGSPEQIIERLNALVVEQVNTFLPTRNGALLLLEKSSQENVEYNRKQVSQLLIDHFSGKANRQQAYWSTSRYLYDGVADDQYFTNLYDAFRTATTWDAFQVLLAQYETDFEARKSASEPPTEVETPDPVSETPVVENPAETPVETETPVTEPAETPETTIPVEETPAEEPEVAEPVTETPAEETPATTPETDPPAEEPVVPAEDESESAASPTDSSDDDTPVAETSETEPVSTS